MEAATRSFIPPVSPLQDKIRRIAGAISLTCASCDTCLGCGGFCKRAAPVVTTHDRLFSPAIVSFAVAEHRCQCVARILGVAMLALLISQVSTTISALLFKLSNAINWVMVHSVDPFSRSRPRLDSTAGVFGPSGAGLCTLLSSFAHTDYRSFTLASTRIAMGWEMQAAPVRYSGDCSSNALTRHRDLSSVKQWRCRWKPTRGLS